MTPEEQTISEILSLSDDKAKIAMIQLLVKQKCIVFAEWVSDQHYSRLRNGNWKKTRDIQEIEKTTDDLNALFLSTNQ
jgi:hypothetical protein